MIAIKQDITVQPGGLIEIRSEQLPAGAHAQVIVLLEEEHADPADAWKSQYHAAPDPEDPLADPSLNGGE
jgi:hypothetical protein